jgi:hypothetical protein
MTTNQVYAKRRCVCVRARAFLNVRAGARAFMNVRVCVSARAFMNMHARVFVRDHVCAGV